MNPPFIRFLLVGLLNTLIDVSLFVVFHSHMPMALANFLSSTIAMVFGYVGHHKFTFGSSTLTLGSVALFAASTGVILWVVQPILIAVGMAVNPDMLTPPALWAKLVAVAVCVLLNYYIYRRWVWPRKATL